MPQARWLQQVCVSDSSRGYKSEIWVPACRVLMRALSWLADSWLLAVSSPRERAASFPLKRTLIPLCGGHPQDLVTSQRPRIPNPVTLGLHHVNWAGVRQKHSVHSKWNLIFSGVYFKDRSLLWGFEVRNNRPPITRRRIAFPCAFFTLLFSFFLDLPFLSFLYFLAVIIWHLE